MQTDVRTVRTAARRQRATLDSERVIPLAEGLIEADHFFQVRAVSQTAADLLGWDRPAALARELNATDWALFDPEVRKDIQFTLALRGRWQGATRLKRKDGTEVQTFVTACALNGSPGVPSGIVVAIRHSNAIDERSLGASQGDLHNAAGLPGHFCLFYQPEIDLRDGSVTSCEALLRWWHPGLGIVSPGAALADRRWFDRLAPVEIWTVFAACRQAAEWAEAGHPVQVAINLSANHLLDDGVIDRFRRALLVTDAPAEHITVDIPANAVLGLAKRTREVARELSSLGVKVAIDDVTRAVRPDDLRGMPVDVIKLARGESRSRRLLSTNGTSVMDLAWSIGATTVAKTVETVPELKALQTAGCERAFGHLFLPPLPPRDLAQLLWPEGATQRATPAEQGATERASAAIPPSPMPAPAPRPTLTLVPDGSIESVEPAASLGDIVDDAVARSATASGAAAALAAPDVHVRVDGIPPAAPTVTLRRDPTTTPRPRPVVAAAPRLAVAST